jgi:rieske iron-sulfur protein
MTVAIGGPATKNVNRRHRLPIDSPQETPGCACTATSSRRGFHARVLAASLVPIVPTAHAQSSKTRAGQRLSFAQGDRAGQEIKPADLVLGQDPIQAFPMEPGGAAVPSRVGMMVVIRIPEKLLSPQVKPHAPQGIVAYSAICTHYGCPISKTDAGNHLVCNCHGSTFDAGQRGVVIQGPATRRLPMVPLALKDGALVLDGSFDGPIGPPT